MKKIIFATNNMHKLEEVKEYFKFYTILSLKDIGFNQEIVEDGLTFQENAFIKANAVYEYTQKDPQLKDYPVLAEDTGLCVKAINYEPGIYSARYSGKGDEGNRQLLLSKLTTIQDRTAYFQCYAVLIMPSGESFVAEGKTYGLITKEKIGDESFGYDCIFWSDKLRKTFGQAKKEEKASVSHRIMAMEKVAGYLQSVGYVSSEDEEEY